jgi:hypothetical protein
VPGSKDPEKPIVEGGQIIFFTNNVDVVYRWSMNFCLGFSTILLREAARTGTAKNFFAPFHQCCARTLYKIEILVFEELGDDKLWRSPQRAHTRNLKVAGLTMRRGACTQKDFRNLFSCDLIHNLRAAAATRF